MAMGTSENAKISVEKSSKATIGFAGPTALAAMIYLSYAGSRFVSMLLDGMPAEGLVQAAVLEAVIGLACLAFLLPQRMRYPLTA